MEEEKRIRELNAQIETVEGRLRGLPKEIQSTRGRIEEIRKKLETEKQEAERLRGQRQTALVKGEEVTGISLRLNRIRESQEILEDMIVGFETKLGQLEAEENETRGKPEAFREEIVKLELVPLVQEYNELGEKMGKVLKDFFPKLWSLRGSERSINAVVFPSSFGEVWTGSLQEIPKLHLGHELKGQSFFSFASLKEEHIRRTHAQLRSEE